MSGGESTNSYSTRVLAGALPVAWQQGGFPSSGRSRLWAGKRQLTQLTGTWLFAAAAANCCCRDARVLAHGVDHPTPLVGRKACLLKGHRPVFSPPRLRPAGPCTARGRPAGQTPLIDWSPTAPLQLLLPSLSPSGPCTASAHPVAEAMDPHIDW